MPAGRQVVKNVLSAVAVAGFGFVLLNLTFMFDWLFQSAVTWLVRLFISINPQMTYGWYPPMMHGLFVVVIGLISWWVFKSKLGVLYKAIYMTVPLAVVLVSIGIFLYRWPVVPYLVGGLFSLGVLYYFYRTRQSWLYYYTVILVSLILGIAGLLGVQI